MERQWSDGEHDTGPHWFREMRDCTPGTHSGDGRRDASAGGRLRRPSSENRTGRRGWWPDARSCAQARAHVPGLRYNLLSPAQLSATFEHPMQLWPRAAVFRCPRDGQSVIFRKSARRLFEATVRRSAIVDQASAKVLVVAKPTTCDTMMFHQLVGHPGEDITCRTAQVAGLRLTGK